ncbi:MAG: PhoPQ-activated pathogenicity-related protein PqaA type, partial [Armatimonadetes bacterium]|nr:PhoPQ-activated pathogenicity-related protein PqaA type [Armatimonadota bacterium]
MARRVRSFHLALLAVLALGSASPTLAGPRPGSPRTALDRYVAKPDPAYTYKLIKSIPGEGYTVHVLSMTSQEWRSASEVDRTRWEHWITIVQPDEVRVSTGLLFISGGSNPGQPPTGADPAFVQMALRTHS